ncbi:hypothetical protein D910_07175 [Dendroctonus ponderosae]|uniref:Coatomer subunit gamma n=1 Tax=Dendroctonus ponderosae TaxID=77166 RepID=U4U7D5_DENPD|nr:hypothetical protein D910_07175 [Dendroctonus ponderosae]
MSAFKRDKKEEEDGEWAPGRSPCGSDIWAPCAGGGLPFQNIEKSAVLQEARIFNEASVNPRKSTAVLTKLLYMLNQGERLSPKEATDVFFAMTKLFQSRDLVLRRLVYMGIKELSTMAEDVIIVTSSLTKDMTGKEDMYRAGAIRALCSITEAGMLPSIERYMKQAIVDRSPAVSSAALISAMHMTWFAAEGVKRWVNEAQEAVLSDNIMVQYHALGLLYRIRRADRLAVSKLVARLTRLSLKSPYAVCMLYIEACFRHKSEMVVYEAARAVVNLERTTSRELAQAVSVLQLFCGAPKATLRFAAVRTLNQVAIAHPAAVTACNLDLENLITDSNRSIATLAITTLLKTGAESSVDRLMKQIATFVSEISDEFKVVVVQAIRALALKFPRKHSSLMNFLSAMLRDEGGLEYKASIADTIITIIEDNPEAKETGLAHLCEFIEDCEHTSLAVRILNLLGKEGPRTKQPSRYIRFIYNRVLLECPSIRAAAVSAMAQFGASCPDLLPNIQVLLARCQMDSDDEVRDRATYYSHILARQDTSLYNRYILDTLQVSIAGLERALREYLDGEGARPFDMLAALGPLFSSSEPVELTESETEYVVRCVKHSYARHLVLQFDCLNTLNDQLLEDVRVQVEPGEGYSVAAVLPCPRLPYNESGSAYVVLQFPEDLPSSVATFGALLKFVVKDCDPATGLPDVEEGYNDEYMLEDLEVTLGDQIRKLGKANWGAAWEEAEGLFSEMEDTYALTSMTSLEEAVTNIVKFLGLLPAERSDKVPKGKTTHTLLLAGVFRGGVDVLVRAKLALADGVTMQLTVRSQDEGVAELITSAVG